MKGLMSSLVALLDIAPGRVFASLGLGFISFAAITSASGQMVSLLEGYWMNVPAAAFQLLSLAGFPTAMGLIVGAVVARLSITTLPKIGKMT